VYNLENGKVVIDQEFLMKKKGLFAQPFPNYDVVGWYMTGSTLTAADFAVNAQFQEVNESPLILLLDPTKAIVTAKRLPIDIFEQEIRVVDGNPKNLFARLVFKIETGESERIAVDHIAHVRPIAEGDSALAAHLEGVKNAIQMLNLRVRNIQKFLDATIKGQIPKDHHLLRQISSMTNMLPAIDSDEFKNEFLMEYNDTILVTYLAAITKTCNLADELNQKFSVSYQDKARRGRGGMGMGMGMF
jgi:COP9 signalosome complex subunit 6